MLQQENRDSNHEVNGSPYFLTIALRYGCKDALPTQWAVTSIKTIAKVVRIS